MKYIIITDNIITNIIVCASDGARIGEPYDPPPVVEGQGLINLMPEVRVEFM